MDRRAFLKISAVSSLAAMGGPDLAPRLCAPCPQAARKHDASKSSAAYHAAYGGRVLVLVELRGGNDGLNTIVPYADSLYYALRPALAVAREQVLPLDERFGLNPALAPLLPAWRGGDLAIALGIGVSNPSRSHLRSREIWATGSAGNEYLEENWLARCLIGYSAPSGGPFAGSLPDPFAGLFVTPYPGTSLGRELTAAAQSIVAGSAPAAISVVHDGYDTHENQRVRHDRLLAELADALAAFRAECLAAGAWDRVLIMTHSEFGRRVAQNVHGGTDHGAAAPHIIMGGRVKGGLYGAQPALDQLDAGDLRHTVDFRRLHATLATRWWGLPANPPASRELSPLEFI